MSHVRLALLRVSLPFWKLRVTDHPAMAEPFGTMGKDGSFLVSIKSPHFCLVSLLCLGGSFVILHDTLEGLCLNTVESTTSF